VFSDAIITLSRKMANFFAQAIPVRVIQPPKGLAEVTITMIHHPLYSQDPAIVWLMEQIDQTIV